MTGILLAAITPVFFTLGAGFLMRWYNWIEPELETSLMKLGLKFLLPCLILDKVVGDPALDDPANVWMAIGLGFGFIVVSLSLAFLFAPLLGLKRGTGKRTFALCTAVQNYGFLAIPVLVSLFGEAPLGVQFLHGMGVELAIWTIGLMALQGAGAATWRTLINGPFIAVLLGLALHYANGEQWIPQPLQLSLEIVGRCAVPMALFGIGATIAHELRHTDWNFHLGTMGGAIVCRLFLFPMLILSVTHLLPASEELRMVMAVQAAMPAAVFPIILAKLYGGHPGTAIQVAVPTTLLSVFTMPFMLALAHRWLGL